MAAWARSAERTAAPAADDARALIERARAGDRSATAALLGGVAPRVLAAVRSVLGKHAPDAEDVAQEGLVALVGALRSFRGECEIGSFACGIAIRTALRSRRKSLRRGRIDAERDEGPVAEEVVDLDGDLQRARRLACMRRLLDELPEAQAEALAMRCLLGDSLPEIAGATGTGINTIRSRIRLAKEALVERIRADPSLRELFEVHDAG